MQNAQIKRCFCGFPLVIARSNERCDVAIKAKPYFATLDSHGHYVPFGMTRGWGHPHPT